MNKPQLPFFTLLLLISFASVNAVLFTPALPEIATFFGISDSNAQLTITLFLTGYALGQLLYGPLANRFGRKPALYCGISLQIISSLLCVMAGLIDAWWLLVLARFLLALGSGVGLKMTFTLVNECYEPKIASQKISYLILAFAITPGLSVALGGILTSWYNWQSCFYAGALYGLLLLFLVAKLPETQDKPNLDALKPAHLLQAYTKAFKNIHLLAGGLLMGASTCFIYVFAALAPFLAMKLSGMSSEQYGMANIIPSLGLLTGSLAGARLAKKYSLLTLITAGMSIASLGVFFMVLTMLSGWSAIFSLFLPAAVIYFGLCLVLANASTMAMSHIQDKAHGSAVMNFINMGMATVAVFIPGLFRLQVLVLPAIYFVLCSLMAGVVIFLARIRQDTI